MLNELLLNDNVLFPDIARLSLTVIVPLEESSVKPPVLVSIVLSFATPIRILSMVAPPSASRSPVNVEIPEI